MRTKSAGGLTYVRPQPVCRRLPRRAGSRQVAPKRTRGGARAVSNPADVLHGLGEPKRSEVQTLYHSGDLTILNVIWAPRMTIMPHNHQVWAVIGVYTGREDNIFWRRVPGGGGKLEAAGARALSAKDATPWRQHHSFGDQSNPPIDRRPSRLRWGLLRRRAQ